MHGVAVIPVPAEQKEVLQNLMQAYLHDMSEYNGIDPDEHGVFQLSQYFELYWTESTRFPFKIMVDQKLAGFALVRVIEPGTHSIAEFFVLRKYRGKGVGKKTAIHLFNYFPGNWHVCQDAENIPSQTFWRRVIGDFTNGNFKESWSPAQPTGPMQIFSTIPR